MPRTIDWVKLLAEYASKTRRLERIIKNINVLSMKDGECKTELVVSEGQLNVEGHLHAGLTTALIDVISNWALVTNGLSGTSVNMHVSFFQQPTIGEVLSINAKVFRLQPPLVFAEVDLLKKNSGDIVARGQHTLFLIPLKPPKIK